METVVRLLPVLACPIIMGLAMWLMMRGSKDEIHTSAAAEGLSRHAPAELGKPASFLRSAWMMVQCCLNWKVIAGLAVAGVGLWLVAPSFALSVLPLLVLLVCPISMLLMMRHMNSMKQAESSAPAQTDLDGALPAPRVSSQYVDNAPST